MVAADRHARGERNGKSKFTEQQIADIRHSPLSQSELGRLYGVSPSTISRIINRVSWKEGPHA
jgi:DNA-binding MarR family transcriptional regulator